MIYNSWDIECNRLKLVIMGHFLPFYLPSLKPKKPEFWKNEKIAGDIIILHKCTKTHNHMTYSSWDTEWDKQNFLSFWTIFWHFTPLTTREIKILKNEKSIWICHHFTRVPKITIIWCMLPEIQNMTDIFFVILGHFLPFFPTSDPKHENLEQM